MTDELIKQSYYHISYCSMYYDVKVLYERSRM